MTAELLSSGGEEEGLSDKTEEELVCEAWSKLCSSRLSKSVLNEKVLPHSLTHSFVHMPLSVTKDLMLAMKSYLNM